MLDSRTGLSDVTTRGNGDVGLQDVVGATSLRENVMTLERRDVGAGSGFLHRLASKLSLNAAI